MIEDGNQTNMSGKPMETKGAAADLTIRQGHPVYNNQS